VTKIRMAPRVKKAIVEKKPAESTPDESEPGESEPVESEAQEDADEAPAEIPKTKTGKGPDKKSKGPDKKSAKAKAVKKLTRILKKKPAAKGPDKKSAKAAAKDDDKDSGADQEWWKVAVQPVKLNQSGVANSFDGDAAKDAPEGEVDLRTTSRAQREVWKNNMHLATQEHRERYMYLKSTRCTEKGKEKEANQIINAYVPRDSGWGGSLKPKALTLKRIHSTVNQEEQSTKVTGMKLHTFIGTNFAGSKELFQDAKDAGEVFEDPEDGMWYTIAKTRRKSSLTKKEDKFEEEMEFGDESDFLKAIMGNLQEEGSLSKWTKSIEKKALALTSQPRQASAKDAVSDKSMALLQESHDGYTRISLAIKRIGAEIMNNREVSSKHTLQTMQKRSMTILKDMVPMSNDIESALFNTPRDELSETKVIGLVQQAVEPYASAWQFYRELIAIFEAAGGMAGMPTVDIKRIKKELK